MGGTNLKRGSWPVLAAVAGGLLGGLLQLLGGSGATKPLAELGRGLRELSLSGSGGNLLAWAIVMAVSALPALGLLWRGRRRTDWLLLLAGGELFAGLYFLINPTLLYPDVFGLLEESLLAQGWGLVAGGCVIGTLAAWVLLRLLDSVERSPARLLPKLLFWAAGAYALLAGAGAVQSLLSDMAAVTESNTGAGRVAVSGLLLAAAALLDLIPSLLGAWVLLWGGGLAQALEEAPFQEETVALAETIAGRCALVARTSLGLSVAGNLLQLLCFSQAASIRVAVHLPVLTLALCAVLLLLCKYFRRAKAVNDDNQTII